MSESSGSVIGIDPASTTGYCVGVPGVKAPFLGSVNFRRDTTDVHADLFGRAHRWITELIAINRPALIAVEQPVPPSSMWNGTNFNTTAISLGLNGIFIGAAVAKRVDVLVAPVTTWRRHFLGAGNARLPGDEAKRAAVKQCRLLGWAPPNADSAEAGGIWLWACSGLTVQHIGSGA